MRNVNKGEKNLKLWSHRTINSNTTGQENTRTFFKFNNAVFLLRDTLENNRVRNRNLVSTNKTSKKKIKNVFRFKSQKKDKNM